MGLQKSGFHLLLWLVLPMILVACGKAAQSSGIETSHKHHHALREAGQADSEAPLPQVSLTALADPMGGWNLHIQTRDFTFTPEQTNGEPISGSGHAHLSVDGYKYARVYGPWYHLKALTPGRHAIQVTLNANDHSTWGHRGQAISSTVYVEQQ